MHVSYIHYYFLQVNYLIDEAVNTGKGANNIISMLHHFLQTHNLGEANLHVHCDNCSGQNKNRFVMLYLCWRVMAGLNRSITVSFLIVGHTKSSPDLGFLSKRSVGRKLGVLMISSRWWRAQLWSITLSWWAHRTVKSLYQPTIGHNTLTTPSGKQHSKVSRGCTTIHSLTSSQALQQSKTLSQAQRER